MIREKLMAKNPGKPTDFRLRSHEISRIEGLSDAVFGFAVTLLVVSLEVPRTFDELSRAMRGFGAFAISFALLVFIWVQQNKFFRRYGLQDNITILLNAILLFVVLFYVYPLKFLFAYLVNVFTGGHGEVRLPNGNVAAMVERADVATLMIIFGIGYVAIFAVFVLLYWHAWRKQTELDLNEIEMLDTRKTIQECALNCLIGVLSISIAAFGGSFRGLAGPVYMLTPLVMTWHGFTMGKRRGRMEAQFHKELGALGASDLTE
jgi:uncharacterized membrane protein